MKAILKVSKVKKINTFLDKQFLTTRRKEKEERDFPGYPVVKTPGFQLQGGAGLIPDRGTEMPHAVWCSQKKK